MDNFYDHIWEPAIYGKGYNRTKNQSIKCQQQQQNQAQEPVCQELKFSHPIKELIWIYRKK